MKIYKIQDDGRLFGENHLLNIGKYILNASYKNAGYQQ